MSEAVVTVIAGLGGALIGGLAAVTGQVLANRHANEAERRRELVNLVARFWNAADRLWFAGSGLKTAQALYQMAVQDENQKSAFDTSKLIDSGLADYRAAASEARFLNAQLRLLHTSVAAAAEALFQASDKFDVHKEAARQAALETYEAAARKLLDSM